MDFCVGCGYIPEGEGCICDPDSWHPHAIRRGTPTTPRRSRPEDELLNTGQAMERFRLKREELPPASETHTNIHNWNHPIRLFKVGHLEAAAKEKYGTLGAMEDKKREDRARREVRQQRKRERETAAAEGRTPEKKGRKAGGGGGGQGGAKGKRQPKETKAART